MEEKTAKELFEELDYYLYNDSEEEFYYQNTEDWIITNVVFSKRNKSFYCESLGRSVVINIKLYKAINKQIKELGWI